MTRSALLHLAMLATMAGCNVNINSSSAPITVTRPFEGRSEGTTTDLAVSVPVGNLTVERDPQSSGAVAISGTLGGEDQATLDAVKVEIVRNDDLVAVNARGPKGKSWRADLTIKIPPGASVELEAAVGDATLNSLDGEIQAKLGVGDFRASDLEVKGFSRFETGTGNATIEVVSWAADQPIIVQAGVGSAKLVVPADTGFTMNASTGVGKVAVSDVSWADQSGKGGPASETVQGTTKASPEGRSLTISTGVGEVSVKTRTSAP